MMKLKLFMVPTWTSFGQMATFDHSFLALNQHALSWFHTTKSVRRTIFWVCLSFPADINEKVYYTKGANSATPFAKRFEKRMQSKIDQRESFDVAKVLFDVTRECNNGFRENAKLNSFCFNFFEWKGSAKSTGQSSKPFSNCDFTVNWKTCAILLQLELKLKHFTEIIDFVVGKQTIAIYR